MYGYAKSGLRREFEQPSNDVKGEVWGSHVAGFTGSAGENGTKHLSVTFGKDVDIKLEKAHACSG